VAALRKEYDFSTGAFMLKLVGKDGGLKRTETEAIAALKFTTRINSTPRRLRYLGAARRRGPHR
jgi:hypothetical protein